MSRVVKVRVTQEDINLGESRNCRWCPVALAMWRATGKRWLVSPISMTVADINDSGSVCLPHIAYLFVLDFDAGRPVQPFEFEVELP